MLSSFVGEFLVLVGAFDYAIAAGVTAAIGVVLAAAYMLWMYQRVVLGRLRNSALSSITDMNRVEGAGLCRPRRARALDRHLSGHLRGHDHRRHRRVGELAPWAKVQASDLTWILPEIIVAGSGMLLLLWTALLRTDDRWWAVSLALGANAAAGIVMALRQPIDGGALEVFSGQLVIDGFSTFFRALFLVVGSLAVITVAQRFERVPFTETAATLQFSLSGMLLMAGAVDWVTAFIALELMAVPVYVLTAMTRFRRESVEAAMKYLVLGAFANRGADLRHRLDLRPHRHDVFPRACRSHHGCWRQSVDAVRDGSHRGRLRFQGSRGAVPRLDAGCLSGRAPRPSRRSFQWDQRLPPLLCWRASSGSGFGFEGAATGTEPSGGAQHRPGYRDYCQRHDGGRKPLRPSRNRTSNACSDTRASRTTGYMLVGLAAVTRVEADTGIASFDFVGLPAVLFYGFVYAFMNFGAFAVAHNRGVPDRQQQHLRVPRLDSALAASRGCDGDIHARVNRHSAAIRILRQALHSSGGG